MRILWVMPTLGPGGAERVMSVLLTWFVALHDVRLLTWEQEGTESFYPLPTSASVVRAGLLGGGKLRTRIARMFGRLRIVRREVRAFRPDMVVSFLTETNLASLAACLGTRVPVIVCERTDPRRHVLGKGKLLLRRALYPRAACCVVQTKRAEGFFRGWLGPKVAVIPNPIPAAPVIASPAKPDSRGRFRIVAIGRLGSEKGHDCLIEAFASVAAAFPLWDLVIFGEGPKRPELENQIARLGLGDRTCLSGITTDPAAELAASHIMALPSHYEGFPNALAEALATGLPAVGMIGVSGVEEMIIDRETGLRVDPAAGPAALADALTLLMGNPELRTRLGGNARLHMRHWRPENIMKQWEALLSSIAQESK